MKAKLNPAQLTVAIIWHMHQPVYKNALTGQYLMPWVRLHAIKDYLDMVLLLKDFPKIKFTVNLVPSLIDQCEDYIQPETHDKQSEITCKETLTDEDRVYVLERCFDAPFHTMISKSTHYTDLFNRLTQLKQHTQNTTDWIKAFSDQELFDICALINLVWFDPFWFEGVKELNRLWEKQSQYTVEDRREIIQIQRDIIASILPTYKKMQEAGQLEVITSPYYHPILPLLINTEHAKRCMPNATLPYDTFSFEEDAKAQLDSAYERYEEIFDTPPAGLWPSEQSISPETLALISKTGFTWAVSDEGNLSKSLGLGRFEKDGLGNLLHPDILAKPYAYNGVKLLFRHLTLSDLIGFHYAKLSPQQAAEDLYWRIKDIHHRCLGAGQQYPVVTIALDGENCWEQFVDDGVPFLRALYQKLSEDDSLNVARVKDYFEAIPNEIIRPLPQLHSGSWINSDYHIWIGDPVKNAAWALLKKTRDDLVYFEKTLGTQLDEATKDHAWDELYIAQGSDWFWWYGEPNHSGQDELFDEQFRMHLANIYRLLKQPIPEYLFTPLTTSMGRTYLPPKQAMVMENLTDRELLKTALSDEATWEFAGQYDLLHGAMHKATRIVTSLHYGSDTQNMYFKIGLNANSVSAHHKVAFYFCATSKTRHNSPIRLKVDGSVSQTQKYLYAYEIKLQNFADNTSPEVRVAEALPDYLWQARDDFQLMCFKPTETEIILVVPFEKLNTWPTESLTFSFISALEDTVDECHPYDNLLHLKRYAVKQNALDTAELLSQKVLK